MMNIFSVIGISRLNLQDFPEMKKKKELSTMCVFPNIGKIMAASGISTYPLECTIVASWTSQPTLFSAAQERQFLAELGEINQREQFRKWPPYLLWFPWPTLLIDIQQPSVRKTRPSGCPRPNKKEKGECFYWTLDPPDQNFIVVLKLSVWNIKSKLIWAHREKESE